MATSKSTDLNYIYLQTYLRLKLSITGLLLKNMNLTIQSIQLRPYVTMNKPSKVDLTLVNVRFCYFTQSKLIAPMCVLFLLQKGYRLRVVLASSQTSYSQKLVMQRKKN